MLKGCDDICVFSYLIGKSCKLNYPGSKSGEVVGIVWIMGEMNIHVQFPDIDTQFKRPRKYFWSAIYPQDYVIIIDNK